MLHGHQCTVVLRMVLHLWRNGSLAFSMACSHPGGSGSRARPALEADICQPGLVSFPDSGTCWRGVPTHEPVGHFTLKPEQQRRLKMLGLQIVS